MALILAESWDGYHDDGGATFRYDKIAGQGGIVYMGPWQVADFWSKPVAGRHGNAGQSDVTAAVATYPLEVADQDDVLFVGFALYRVSGSAFDLMQFLTGTTTVQDTINVNSNGTIRVYRGTNTGTLLGTTVTTLPQNEWHFVEIKIKLHDTTGAIILRIDGTTVLSLSNIDTINSGTPTAIDTIKLLAVNKAARWDDFYLLNEQGSRNNDFLGDVTVECLQPTAAGDSTGWTPSAGANWDAVADPPSAATPNTADYVSSATDNAEDLYNFADTAAVAPSTIAGVVLGAWATKTDTGARSLALSAKLGASHTQGADKAVQQNGTWHKHGLDLDPAAVAWTFANLNASQIGVVCRP